MQLPRSNGNEKITKESRQNHLVLRINIGIIMGWVTSQEWQLGQESSVTPSNLWVLKENLMFLIVRHGTHTWNICYCRLHRYMCISTYVYAYLFIFYQHRLMEQDKGFYHGILYQYVMYFDGTHLSISLTVFLPFPNVPLSFSYVWFFHILKEM